MNLASSQIDQIDQGDGHAEEFRPNSTNCIGGSGHNGVKSFISPINIGLCNIKTCFVQIIFQVFAEFTFYLNIFKCHIDFHQLINCILKQSKSIQQYSISGIFAKRITVFMYVLQIFQIANIVELMYCIHNTLSCTSIK